MYNNIELSDWCLAVSKSFGNGVKSAHTPPSTYSALGKASCRSRFMCQGYEAKTKLRNGSKRNELTWSQVEWSGIISGEMLARKFDALTFHVKARSIDKLIRIRPWECIINIYSTVIAALQQLQLTLPLAWHVSPEPFQFQLQFKRPSITPPPPLRVAWGESQWSTLKRRLNSTWHLGAAQPYFMPQPKPANELGLWQRSHLSQLPRLPLSDSQTLCARPT